MPKFKYKIEPNSLDRPKAVRGAYLYNLVDCIHNCILRRDLPRARRAWAIFVRCPDVDWRDKWGWALYLLNANEAAVTQNASESQPSAGARARSARTDPLTVERGKDSDADADTDTETDTVADTDTRPPNPYAHPPQSQQQTFSQRAPGEDTLLFLRNIQLLAAEADKPGVLAEITLHLIAVGRCREALDEINMWVTGYPYTLSAPLRTYAGMICFYLAQPPSMRRAIKPVKVNARPSTQEAKPSSARLRGSSADTDDRSRAGSADSSATDTTVEPMTQTPPDANYLRQAREWFTAAVAVDKDESVAQGFLKLLNKPMDASDDDMDLDQSFEQSFDRSRDMDADEDVPEDEGEEDDDRDRSVDLLGVGSDGGSEMDISPAPPRAGLPSSGASYYSD